MKKTTYFQVNHLKIVPGIYVSRKDQIDDKVLTTFDLRFTQQSIEPPMDTAGIHSIEYLFAAFLRNHEEWASRTIYFGPMGSRTGFYVIFSGDYTSEDILGVLREGADYILNYEGEIPGYSPRDCGDYLDNNLAWAQFYIRKYKIDVLDNPTDRQLNYPQD